jgi:hypothetical protein
VLTRPDPPKSGKIMTRPDPRVHPTRRQLWDTITIAKYCIFMANSRPVVQDQYCLTSNKLQQNGFQMGCILTIMECRRDQGVLSYLSWNFFYQLLNLQRTFNKKEKTRTNENSTSLHFIYNYTQTKITYTTIHI